MLVYGFVSSKKKKNYVDGIKTSFSKGEKLDAIKITRRAALKTAALAYGAHRRTLYPRRARQRHRRPLGLR